MNGNACFADTSTKSGIPRKRYIRTIATPISSSVMLRDCCCRGATGTVFSVRNDDLIVCTTSSCYQTFRERHDSAPAKRRHDPAIIVVIWKVLDGRQTQHPLRRQKLWSRRHELGDVCIGHPDKLPRLSLSSAYRSDGHAAPAAVRRADQLLVLNIVPALVGFFWC